MKIDNVFPIPIARFDVDKSIVDNTTMLVKKFIEDTKFTEPAHPGELLTTFYDNKNFLGRLGDHALLQFINKHTREYLEVLGYDPKCYIEITSWLQLNQPLSYFARHDHYGAVVSGVMYLEVPSEGGDIMFHNPLECRRLSNTFFERAKKEENEYNFSHVKYKSTVGEMIMFESWLQHTVMQNLSTDNRLAVAFNIWVDKDVKS